MHQYWTNSATVRRDNEEVLFFLDHVAKFGSSKGYCRVSIEHNGLYEIVGQVEQHTPTESQLWALYLAWLESRAARRAYA